MSMLSILTQTSITLVRLAQSWQSKNTFMPGVACDIVLILLV